MADTIVTFQDGSQTSSREFYQKYSVFVRLVKKTTKRVSWKSVGYQSFSAADAVATEKATIAGNSDVRVVPVGGGLFNVTWTAGTVTTTYGPWYIPTTPS